MNNRVNNTKSEAASAATDPGTITLEQRCVAALSDNTLEARAIADLITETEKATSDAEVIATRMQEIALDPDASPDAAKAKEAAEFATFVAKRVNNILPRLRSAHQRVAATERATRWKRTADQVEERRDELTELFSKVYPDLINQIVDLFNKVKFTNAEVDTINSVAPNSESRRLLPVGVRADIAIGTKLLDLSGKQVWPTPQPAILPEQVMPVMSHPGRDWARANQQRDAERHAEAKRVASFYANQQKVREDKENAEARAAKEAHLRNGGRP